MDYSYDANKEGIAKTFVSDVFNGEDTDIRIEKYCGCLWIFFGADENPALVIESYQGEMRVGIYPEDDPDIEPDMHTVRVSGGW